MRKVLWVTTLIGVFLVVAFMTVRFVPRWQHWPGRRPVEGGASSRQANPADERELPLLPSISLQINREREVVVYQGTPLIFFTPAGESARHERRGGEPGESSLPRGA